MNRLDDLAERAMRYGLLALVVLAVAQGAWLVLSESFAAMSMPGLAAQVGLVRGDLWERAADEDGPRGTAAARAGLAAAPLRSRLWLRLADAEPAGGAAALRMAFLTGGGNAHDLPRRLLDAARLPAGDDPLEQGNVARDIAYVLLRRPDLRPALRAAYAAAPTAAKRKVFDDIAAGVAPDFRY